MHGVDAAIWAAAGMFAVMAFAWVVQFILGNAGWVDACWTFGTGVCGAAAALAGGGEWRPGLVAAGAVLWALRLGLHIAGRTAHGPEDARYAAFRREWGAAFQRRMFRFLMIQAAAALPLIGAIALAAGNPAPAPRPADALAVLVLLAALVGEAVADGQMERFRRDPTTRGRVCDRGLWALSRHPNYFFEWLGWIAYPIFAIDASWPWGWLTLAAPAMMYWLLVYVSGIPPLEAAMLRSRGSAYRAYQARTSAFFPRPQRRAAR